jgi:UDP-N-acetylglucosamine 1-carboxyvinyltransferase
MRASFCVLGPLLARRGKAVVSLPGGCRIGARPVDLHLKGLAALGAELTLAHGYVIARAKRLRGTTIDLTGPAGSTVTGTANVLSAAVLAQGETVLRGAAREPEIVDLGRLLCKMGARIDGLGTNTLQVRGVEQLGGARHRIIPDRIEAATLALAVAATRGTAEITGAEPEHLTAVLNRLADARIDVTATADRISVAAPRPPRPCGITAEPYPGIPSDVQAQWMALMTLAPGQSIVSDRVFPQRFSHVPELVRMGARINLAAGSAIVNGAGHLNGATVIASDLRASAALVIAGLAARGNTRIDQTHWLDRGYEDLPGKLRTLGADPSMVARLSES